MVGAHMQEKRKEYMILCFGKPEEVRPLEDRGIDGKITLKLMWTAFTWFRI
jgi:hypothetical protein